MKRNLPCAGFFFVAADRHRRPTKMRQQKDCSPVAVVRDWFTAHEKEIDWSRIKTELSSTGAVSLALTGFTLKDENFCKKLYNFSDRVYNNIAEKRLRVPCRDIKTEEKE